MMGDTIQSTWEWRGGDIQSASSWTNVENNGYSSYLKLSDRVIFGTDGWLPAQLYNITSDSWKSVLMPMRNQYSTSNIFRTIAYDSLNNVIYFPTGNTPVPVGCPTYQSLFASTDGGCSWVLLARLQSTPDQVSFAQDVAVFGNYVYLAYPTTGLERFERLTSAQVATISNQDYYSKIIDNNGFLASGNSAYTGATVTISSASMTNLLTNPSFESWGSPPIGWQSLGSSSWNGVCTYIDGGPGIDGAHSFGVIMNGYGNLDYGRVAVSARVPLTQGTYLYTGYMKINASYPLARGSIKAVYSNGTVAQETIVSLLPCFVNNWVRIDAAFTLTSNDTVDFLFYPIEAGLSSTYQINLTSIWDGFSLYKCASQTDIPSIPYTTSTFDSIAGSIIIGDKTVTWNTLPTTIAFDYFSGSYDIQLSPANIVTVTVTGTKV
jgi:hypothetical protein